jgi:hypothetical protein
MFHILYGCTYHLTKTYMTSTIKFKQNYIQQEDRKYKVWYSLDENGITICGRNYERFRGLEGLEVKNDSDIMTDYFDNSRIRIRKDDKYFNEALKAYEAKEEMKTQKELNRNLKKALLWESIPETNKKKVDGKRFLITKQYPHNKLEGFTTYEMALVSGKGKKTYFVSEHPQGRRTKLYSI